MGCCFCCMSEDDQIMAVMEKLEVDRVANAGHGQTKFWVGRIVLTSSPLIAPVSGKQCAYYEVRCEEYCKHIVQHTDEEGNTHSSEEWTWDYRFTEERRSDFILADPAGTPAFVPGGSYPTKFYSVVDASNQDSQSFMSGMKGFFSGDMGRSDLIEDMLKRNGQRGSFGRDDQGKFRYHESSFTVNEQVAVLGTAQPHTHQGVNLTILTPPSTDILNQEYFDANGWSGNDIKSWEALTKTPSVIGSDDPKYFKGISVEDLSMNYSPFSFCAPVYYGAPMQQMQGQPMMQQQGMQMQPMMQQQQPMQMQGQPMQYNQQMQGQPMMQQQQQQQPMQYNQQMQGQPMMQQQQPMQYNQQMQGQPMMQQQQPMQYNQPMQGQPMMQQQPMQQQQQPMQQQNFGPSTIVPEPQEQQQQQPAVMPTIGGTGPQIIPTIAVAQ